MKTHLIVNLEFHSYHEFVLFPVHNDSCNLLIHEHQNRSKQCRSDGHKAQPPGVTTKWMDQPIPATPRGFELVWHMKFRSFDPEHQIQDGHRRDGDDDGKVGDEAANVGGKKVLKEQNDGFQFFHKQVKSELYILLLLFQRAFEDKAEL